MKKKKKNTTYQWTLLSQCDILFGLCEMNAHTETDCCRPRSSGMSRNGSHEDGGKWPVYLHWQDHPVVVMYIST